MTVTAPPLDLGGAELDRQIAVVQALVGTVSQQITADTILITADNINVTADAFGKLTTVLWQYEALLNQLQVEAVDHYMVTGWLNAAAVLTQFGAPPAWDTRGQEKQARVTYLTALVANPPVPPPGNASGYGSAGWVTVLQNYRQQLYEAQITLVEHIMDLPGGTTAATILSTMTGSQSFPFQYTSGGALPPMPFIPPMPTPPPPPPPPPPPVPHNVGGVLSGMAPGASISLQLNGGNTITLNANGAFVFPISLPVGTSYAVTVLAPPVGQPAVVSNGTGVVAGADVGNVQVAAGASTLHVIGGTLSGLTGVEPVVLQNNGGDNLTLTTNGTFVFAVPVADGQTYNVTVLSGPSTLNVTLANAAGVVVGADITNVTASCAPPATYFIGGTLSGLASGQSIVLQNNNGDDLTLSANGTFAFATKLLAGAAYNATVLTLPGGQKATLSRATGAVGNADVTNIGIVCAALPTFSVGGSVFGLPAGKSVVLQNNGGDDITVSANGAFAFPTKLLAGVTYAVTVLTPPTAGTATVTNPTGTITNHNITGVAIHCALLPTFSVGGTLTGLPGALTVTLQNNGGDNLVLSANGAFTFATELLAGDTYNVTVLTPPSGGSCAVTNGMGVMPSADVTNVAAACVAPPLFTLGGTVTGLPAGTSVTLQNNGGDNITLNANGAFTFPTGMTAGTPYAVTVLTAPSGGTCMLTNDTGTMPSANVTNVGAACAASPLFSVGGTLSGLPSGSTITLQNNAGDNLTLSANGSYAFATKLLAGAAYAVTILTQPTGATATLANASGTMPSANVTNVKATCVPATFTVGGTLSGLSAGKTIKLQNNAADTLTLSANGPFTFVTAIATGVAYAVTVLTPPVGETVALANATGTMASANVTNVGVTCSPNSTAPRRFRSGAYVTLSYAQAGLGPGGQNLSADSGPFSYAAGTAAVPLTITGNYSDGTIPGGHLGTGTSSGCHTGTGTGGHTLSRNGTGPAVNFDATHRTQALVPRYPWNDIEPTMNNYNFTRMDADLAQCIALDVLWFPVIVFHTFGPNETATGTNGNSIPTYMQAYCTPGSLGGQDAALWRWNVPHVVPRTTALFTAIGKRYDLCPNFGGICTQETSTSNADTTASGYSGDNYLAALSAESDAIATASPNSRHLAFQNFGGGGTFHNGSNTGVMIDQYAAYIQKNGAILAGPDLVLCGGSVYDSCYTSGSGVQAGRYSGYHFGGTIGSGVKFSSTGPTGCSLQRVEWIGGAPACTVAKPIQKALNYLKGSSLAADGQQPNFLAGDVLPLDWHQEPVGSSLQAFTPDGVNLIKNNAIPFGTWSP